jgi:hypothetical protein
MQKLRRLPNPSANRHGTPQERRTAARFLAPIPSSQKSPGAPVRERDAAQPPEPGKPEPPYRRPGERAGERI